MLAFPGGYEGALLKLKEGSLEVAETAIVYLENTPYCFRSQYVAKEFKRGLNKIDLPEDMKERFYAWKDRKSQKT